MTTSTTWLTDLHPGVEIAAGPLPPSFPTELASDDGIRIVGLRAADADAQRRLLRALDHTAQHDTSYVLLGMGGFYCSRAVLRDAFLLAQQHPGVLDEEDSSGIACVEPPDVIDFSLQHGFHAADHETGLEGRRLFQAAVRTTCLHNHAASSVAHRFLQSGVADLPAARLLTTDDTLTPAWRRVMRQIVDGPHARPHDLREFRRQQRDLRASIAMAVKATAPQRGNEEDDDDGGRGHPGSGGKRARPGRDAPAGTAAAARCGPTGRRTAAAASGTCARTAGASCPAVR